MARLGRLVEELMAQRAEERVGETVEVLVESVAGARRREGRAAHQAPEVDGITAVVDLPAGVGVGDLVRARVTGSAGRRPHRRYLDTVDGLADRTVVRRVRAGRAGPSAGGRRGRIPGDPRGVRRAGDEAGRPAPRCGRPGAE